MSRLQQEGVIDDSEYARMFASRRHCSALKGKRLIRQELEQRGISKETAGLTVEALDEGAERDAARKGAD